MRSKKKQKRKTSETRINNNNNIISRNVVMSQKERINLTRIFFEENRRIITTVSTIVFVVLLILSIFLIRLNSNNNQAEEIQYADNQNIEYKVNLKANKYYEKAYSEKDNQYISSLIENIETNFKYNFKIDNDFKYDYNYKIVADINVQDNKTSKSIYAFSEDLVAEKVGKSEGGKLGLNETITLDYNKYNNLIREFVTVYDLNNATSKVTLTLVVGLNGKTKEFTKKEMPVMSLDIPLALNTISIDTNYNLAGSPKAIILPNNEPATKFFLTFGIALLIVDCLVYISAMIILNKLKTEEDKYNDKIRKIMNNYDSYISKVENEIDLEGYQILKIEKFIDLLEIRDTMQLPILMVENKDTKNTCFYIATSNKILYFYSISVNQYALPIGNK